MHFNCLQGEAFSIDINEGQEQVYAHFSRTLYILYVIWAIPDPKTSEVTISFDLDEVRHNDPGSSLLVTRCPHNNHNNPLRPEPGARIATSHIFLKRDNKIPLHIPGNGQ
jgi:hypothetical protein